MIWPKGNARLEFFQKSQLCSEHIKNSRRVRCRSNSNHDRSVRTSLERISNEEKDHLRTLHRRYKKRRRIDNGSCMNCVCFSAASAPADHFSIHACAFCLLCHCFCSYLRFFVCGLVDRFDVLNII